MGVARAIRYPLTATCLSKANCKTLDTHLLAVALPALGFPAKFHTKLLMLQPQLLALESRLYEMTKT
jgi:hypothetical protein